MAFNRDPQALQNRNFDLLIIGGGIYGLGVAWEAALRGLSVALVEKNDFGSGTSAGCFKIVHGGLRYLPHLELGRFFESVREQRILRTIAPHLVHPLPFLVPCYGRGAKSKAALDIGCSLYELLALFRNQGVDSEHVLPQHKALSTAEVLAIAPGIQRDNLNGGVVFYDAQMSNCDRLTLAVAQSAALAGAKVCNYVEATALVRAETGHDSEHIAGIELLDRRSGRAFKAQAKVYIDATGPWSDRLLSKFFSTPKPTKRFYSKGIQLVVPQIISKYAVAVESPHVEEGAAVSRGGRSYFLVPWRDRTLVGTYDELSAEEPDQFRISPKEIKQFVDEVQTAYSSQLLSADRVGYAFGGLRELSAGQSAAAQSGRMKQGEAPVSRTDEITDHAVGVGAGRISNLITVHGMKYTTFRALSEKVVSLAVSKARLHKCSSRSANTPLAGAPDNYLEFKQQAHSKYDAKLSAETCEHLLRSYGTRIDEVMSIAEQDSKLGDRLARDNETIGAELVYAARNEMAETLLDIVLRRTALGTLGTLGSGVINAAGEIVGSELGWSESKRKEEIDSVCFWYESQSR